MVGAWPTALFLLVGFVVLVMTAAAGGPDGEPEQRGDRYVLRYQREVTEITRDEYVRYENLDRRWAAGTLGALQTPGLALGLYALGRRRRDRQAVGT